MWKEGASLVTQIEISLKNVASYKEEAKLQTEKKINLIYGLNGSGKTIFSNYLYRKSKNEVGPDTRSQFQECSDNLNKDVKILVYNEEFIKDNFYETDTQRGIFTLSEKNKEAEKEIKKAEDEKEVLKANEEKLREEKRKIDEKIEKNKKDSEEKIWKVKENYAGPERPLNYCLEGLRGDKTKLFDYLCNFLKPDEQPQRNIEDLKEEANLIKHGNKEDPIEELNSSFSKPLEEDDISTTNISVLERQPIFKGVIESTVDNPVYLTIKELGNLDWVRRGIEYLPLNIQGAVKCPFCQEKTITPELAESIKGCFDKAYKQKVFKISKMKNAYGNFIKSVKSFYTNILEHSFCKKKQDFLVIARNLEDVLKGNLEKIEKKEQSPGIEIFLKESKNQINELNAFIQAMNLEIKRHNKKIQNSEEEKLEIKNGFWKIIRWEYDGDIQSYQKMEKHFKEDIKNIELQIKGIEQEIKVKDKNIKENQEKTQNLDGTIDEINKGLRDMGINDFEIDKFTDSGDYFLKRQSAGKLDFRSLSEGEKTVISFLYFLSLCRGRTELSEVSSKKIIVLDDPISSLSHIYVFNIAQLIKKKFFENNDTYEKVFVLTHSLYFFHELNKIIASKRGDDCKLFRVIKNQSSKINKMEKNTIKNDYEYYWIILKEFEAKGELSPILPNVMRNVLECFFGFIERLSLQEALNKLDSGKYSAFIRYMNRESHFDRENIADMKEIDHSKFFEAFKEVFEIAEYQGHYKKMMR